ncbi:MAG TPA: MoaD/ThiS family protein [Nitriliruptorales bacterium]|nr:MoaD/ThiS family protein [Nitriliruptorales bacterium]
MAVTVRIPSPLRRLSGGDAEVTVEAGDVRGAIAQLEAAHPGFADRLLDGDGRLRRFVNVFVRDEDVRFQQGLDTAVADGDVISIVPAVAGG